MNSEIKQTLLPSKTTELLINTIFSVDNVLSSNWKGLKFANRLNKAKFSKRCEKNIKWSSLSFNGFCLA